MLAFAGAAVAAPDDAIDAFRLGELELNPAAAFFL